MKIDKYTGGKFNKGRVLVGRNADLAEKIKFFVIGKSRKLHCFKRMKRMLCEYEKQKEAWMNG